MREITKLKPTKPQIPKRLRAAGYARVSSGKDAMLNSLSAQVSYYSGYIQRHRGWEFAGVYAEMKTTSLIQFNYSYLSFIYGCIFKNKFAP